jgi:hypothetical protein
MTKETYTALIFEQLVPAILQNWPRANRHVLIQQDNATPHITPNEFRVLWLERKVELQNAHGDGLDWDLQFYFQPANSPDLNINDLGFFASIQALQYQHPSANIGEMIARVLQLYVTYPHTKLNNVFLTLQTCMNQIIEGHGSNDYKILHMNKARLERLGLLPQSIAMTDAADDWLNPPSDDDESDNDQ